MFFYNFLHAMIGMAVSSYDKEEEAAKLKNNQTINLSRHDKAGRKWHRLSLYSL
jgi:hypothetical protein